jgi:hypothetical protein
MTFQTATSHIQFAGSILLAFLCFRNYTRISLPIKVLGYYSLSSIVFQSAQIIVIAINKKQYLNQIGDGFVLAETVMLSMVFLFAFNQRIATRTIIFLIVAYTLFYAGQLMFNENGYSVVRSGRDILMIALAIGYFYYLIKKQPEKDLLKFSMFWVSAGVIFYFSGTFILSLFLSYLTKASAPKFVAALWGIRNLFRLAFCLVLSHAVLLDIKKGAYGTNTF